MPYTLGSEVQDHANKAQESQIQISRNGAEELPVKPGSDQVSPFIGHCCCSGTKPTLEFQGMQKERNGRHVWWGN